MVPPIHPGATASGRVSLRSTLRAWWPTARGLPIGTLLGIAGLTVAPALIVVAQGEQGYGNAVAASALLGTGAVAFTVDDPAAETLQASPTSLARRHGLRLSVIGIGLAATWGLVIAIAAMFGTVPTPELRMLTGEAAVAAGVALAFAAQASRSGAANPSHLGAIAGPLGVLVITGLAQRIDGLPALASPMHHDRWWYLAALAWAVALWSWRDPAR